MPPRKWPPLKVAKAPCPCNVVNESAAVNEWRDKRVRAAEQGDVAHCRAARTCCALCRVHVAPSRKRRPLSGPRPSRTHQSVRRNSGKPCKRALKKIGRATPPHQAPTGTHRHLKRKGGGPSDRRSPFQVLRNADPRYTLDTAHL